MRHRLLEAEWVEKAQALLDVAGWRWVETKPTRRSGAGAPDVIACRPPRILALEFKRASNRASDAQKAWLRDMAASGAEAHLLTFPGDWWRFEQLIAQPPIQESWTSNSTSATYAHDDK